MDLTKIRVTLVTALRKIARGALEDQRVLRGSRLSPYRWRLQDPKRSTYARVERYRSVETDGPEQSDSAIFANRTVAAIAFILERDGGIPLFAITLELTSVSVGWLIVSVSSRKIIANGQVVVRKAGVWGIRRTPLRGAANLGRLPPDNLSIVTAADLRGYWSAGIGRFVVTRRFLSPGILKRRGVEPNNGLGIIECSGRRLQRSCGILCGAYILTVNSFLAAVS